MAEKMYGPEHYAAKFDPKAYLDYYYSRSSGFVEITADLVCRKTILQLLIHCVNILDKLSAGELWITGFPSQDQTWAARQLLASEALRGGIRLSLFALPNFAKQIGCDLQESERQTLIDIGAGPTVYSAICFRNVVKRIFLTDFTQKNLDNLQDWVDTKNAFDWTGVIDVIRSIEGNGSVKEKEIEDETRCTLSAGGVYYANVHNVACGLDATLHGEQFDILVSVFCLESACSSHEQFRHAIRNMLQLLRPGGRLILGSVIENTCYNAGRSRIFSILSLTEDEIECELQKNDIDPQSLHKIILSEEGVMFIMGTKKDLFRI